MAGDGNEAGHHPVVQKLLGPGEEVQHVATAGEAVIAVTSHRLAVIQEDRTALDVGIDNVRRIQFDIEKARPATLVIVPEHPNQPPQVLAVKPEEYEEVASALVTIGHRLAGSAQGVAQTAEG